MDANSVIASAGDASSSEPTKMRLVKMSSSTQENTSIDMDTTIYSINKEPNSINIRTDNINIQTTSINSVNPFEQIVLDPPDINFKKNLKGYKTKEKAYKLNMKKELIINHINSALSIYTDDEKKYNTDIVLFVCQCVEDLINVPKSGELKSEVVQKVCAKYFEGKEELVMVIINLMYSKIIKTSFIRRSKLQLQRLMKIVK